MKGLQLVVWVLCVGCGGAQFTSISASAVDAGEILEDAPSAIAPRTDAGDVASDPPAEASSRVDAGDVDQVDAGEVLEAGPELDAAGEDHHVVMTCTASECPACPTLESKCCTASLHCGCYAPGIVCR